MRSKLFAGLAVLVVLTACGKPREEEKAPTPVTPAAVAPTGFTHDPAFDAAGYYKPVTTINIGGYRLDHIAVGAPSDFDEWEKGTREGVFGPIMLEFEDTSSRKSTNEMGQEVHDVRIRVMPTAYRVNSTDLVFAGADPKIGTVVFEGGLDAPSFTEAHKTGSSGSQPVAIGNLTLGTNTIRNQKFTYFAGD